MKKRMALTAAIAMAISVAGMLPASSATKLGAPTGLPSGTSCTRAGDTLQITSDTEASNIEISRDSDELLVTGATCSGDNDLLLGLSKVVIKAADATASENVNVRFDLENDANDGRLANFSAIAFTVQVDGVLQFDGSGIDWALAPVRATVTEESFAVGTLSGTYYAGDMIEFDGTQGNDSFDASAVATTNVEAYGDLGNDTLKSGAGDDSLYGEGGNDKLYGGAGTDSLDTQDGGDYLDDPATDADQAWGGAGDDSLYVDAADTAAPGDGEDTVSGHSSSDLGAGNWIGTLYYGDSSAGITVDLEDEAGVVRSTAGDDYYDDIVVAFVGSAFADTMSGATTGFADDVFVGGDGADKLFGFGGADTLQGGGGTDTIKGGEDDDTISGDSGADKITGGSGNDTVYGGGGDDIMYGSVGDDVLKGMKGSDQAWGGKGREDICSAEVTDGCEYKK